MHRINVHVDCKLKWGQAWHNQLVKEMRTTNSHWDNSSWGKHKNNWTICPMFLCSCQIIPSCSHTAEIYGQSWQEKLALHPQQFCSSREGESWLFLLLLAMDPTDSSWAGHGGWLHCISLQTGNTGLMAEQEIPPERKDNCKGQVNQWGEG